MGWCIHGVIDINYYPCRLCELENEIRDLESKLEEAEGERLGLKKPKFQFSNVVVVGSGHLIGCIVKTWGPSLRDNSITYDVYVRSSNSIQEYTEDQIQHFVYSKNLSEEEIEFYD